MPPITRRWRPHSGRVDGFVSAKPSCFSFEARKDLTLKAARYLRGDLMVKCDASDLVQQTFEAALRGVRDFKGRSEEEFASWLMQILTCRVADLGREFRGTLKRALGRQTPLLEESRRAWNGASTRRAKALTCAKSSGVCSGEPGVACPGKTGKFSGCIT